MNREEETDHLSEQLLKYLDGNLGDQERLAIEEQLKSDRSARDLLRDLAEHAVVTADVARLEEVHNTTPRPAASSSEPIKQGGFDERTLLVRGRKTVNGSIRKLSWVAFAGVAIVALSLPFFMNRVFPDKEPPTGVAKVIHIEGEVQANDREHLAIGDEVFAGDQLTMNSGLIELAYRETGVHALATAPFSLQMISTKRVNLLQGEMKLVVPPQGIGFVVNTPERKITDLGTSFVVKASETGSSVLVLDGQIAIQGTTGEEDQLMTAGDLAKFGRNGKVHLRVEQHPDIAEPSFASLTPNSASLRGKILGFEGSPALPRRKPKQDVIARQILPLVESGFQNQSCLDAVKHGAPLRFLGIAGSYKTFPDRAGLAPYSRGFGWLAWYSGQARPPQPGRYRFWGYTDNHLLVSLDGKPVFEGSRRDSPFKELGIPRTDHPSYPCLNAMAGFACGEWFELGPEGAQLDLVFGEIMNHETSGLLLIEREGETYEETYWGQPKWSLFLTEILTEDEIAELETLRKQMEAKLIGSFSISNEAVWEVTNE